MRLSPDTQILRRLFHLAWPMLIAQLASMASGVVDTMMAGRIGAVDLAAIGIGASIYVSVFISLLGILMALTPMVAQLHGGGRQDEVGEEVRQSAWLALLLATLIMILLRYPEPLIALSQLQPEVEIKVRAYLGAISWAVPAALLFQIFYGLSTGIGQPRPIMVLYLIGLALKVPLNYVFMYCSIFGFPPMGGPGCAVATALIAWLGCGLAWLWCWRIAEYREFGVFSRFSWPRRAALLQLLKLGLPISATLFVDVTAFTFMTLFIARLGPVASGAHQIAANLAVLAYMLPLSLGNAAAVLAGQALGAGDAALARRSGFHGILVCLALGFLVCAALSLFAEPVARLYTGDREVIAGAVVLIGMVAFYHVFDALQGTTVCVLRGYKKTTVPMMIYAVALWGVGLSGGYVLGLTDWLIPAAGARGFWLAAMLSLAIAGGLVMAYFERISRQAQKAVAPIATRT